MRPMKYLKNAKGFTLIEIISVVLVMGIISAVAIPMFDTAGIDVSVAASTVQSDTRYVQELAMTRGQSVSITFTQGAFSYDVPADPNGVFPLETRDLSREVSILSPTTLITFNSFGEKVGGTATIVLQTGSETSTITIEQFTGRVSIL